MGRALWEEFYASNYSDPSSTSELARVSKACKHLQNWGLRIWPFIYLFRIKEKEILVYAAFVEFLN